LRRLCQKPAQPDAYPSLKGSCGATVCDTFGLPARLSGDTLSYCVAIVSPMRNRRVTLGTTADNLADNRSMHASRKISTHVSNKQRTKHGGEIASAALAPARKPNVGRSHVCEKADAGQGAQVATATGRHGGHCLNECPATTTFPRPARRVHLRTRFRLLQHNQKENMAGEGAVRYSCGKPACSLDQRHCLTTCQVAEANSTVMGRSIQEQVLIMYNGRSTTETVDREMRTLQEPLSTKPQASTFLLYRCTLQHRSRRYRTNCDYRIGNGTSEQPDSRRCHLSRCFHKDEMFREGSPSCLGAKQSRGVSVRQRQEWQAQPPRHERIASLGLLTY